MKYVLDASVALKWVIQEDDSGRALFLREELLAGLHEYIAPDIFRIEIAHVLTSYTRRPKDQGPMSRDDAETHLAGLLATLPQMVPSVDLLPAAFDIALTTRTGFYDALYLALGQSENVPVITADKRMAKLKFNIIELSTLGA